MLHVIATIIDVTGLLFIALGVAFLFYGAVADPDHIRYQFYALFGVLIGVILHITGDWIRQYTQDRSNATPGKSFAFIVTGVAMFMLGFLVKGTWTIPLLSDIEHALETHDAVVAERDQLQVERSTLAEQNDALQRELDLQLTLTESFQGGRWVYYPRDLNSISALKDGLVEINQSIELATTTGSDNPEYVFIAVSPDDLTALAK